MKFTKTSWMALGIGIIIIGAVSFYMAYQGQVQERDDASASLANAQAAVPVRITERNALESQLSQLEDELQEWQSQISQLETELAQAELALDQTGARFPISVESIEYDEVLFGFARDANLRITSLTASEPTDITTEDITVPTEIITTEDITAPTEITIEGITYATTSFTVAVRGEVADILYFINTIVVDDDFQTAILKPITIDIPEPLTETEKENLTEEEIEEAEMPSATINLMLYTYQGEGE